MDWNLLQHKLETEREWFFFISSSERMRYVSRCESDSDDNSITPQYRSSTDGTLEFICLKVAKK